MKKILFTLILLITQIGFSQTISERLIPEIQESKLSAEVQSKLNKDSGVILKVTTAEKLALDVSDTSKFYLVYDTDLSRLEQNYGLGWVEFGGGEDESADYNWTGSHTFDNEAIFSAGADYSDSKVTGVLAGTNPTDAVNKAQLDDEINNVFTSSTDVIMNLTTSNTKFIIPSTRYLQIGNGSDGLSFRTNNIYPTIDINSAYGLLWRHQDGASNTLFVIGDNGLSFSTGALDSRVNLKADNLTTNRDVQFQDKDGTVAYIGDITDGVQSDITGLTNAVVINNIVSGNKSDIESWAGDANRVDLCLDCPRVETATGTTIDMSGLTQDNFGAASSDAVFTMVNIAVGSYAEVLVNKTGAPTVTGATQMPNTATFIDDTDMILCIKDFNGTRKYWFVEF